jgi:hypothetical protein
VWWTPDRNLDARWSFHLTRAAALAAAPTDRPFSVVDITRRPDRRMPFIDALLARTRVVEGDGDPYPQTSRKANFNGV